jgi:DNA-binding LytR/AlgR family response regulator
MRVLIIEDEPLAAQRLETILKELVPEAIIVAKIDAVKKAVKWLKENPSPDLVLMDIQLADGVSFQIFDQHPITAPIIFTTAYDAYALQAFKVNSIDYILKPVDKQELSHALDKLARISKSETDTRQLMENIGQAVQMILKKYKTRFVIKVGEHLKTIEVDSIRYFFSQDKATFCVTEQNRNMIVDYTLEQLEEMVDPNDFFRINRKYLVRAGSIQDIIHYTNSRLKLILKGSQETDIIVARERVQEFKEWLDR